MNLLQKSLVRYWHSTVLALTHLRKDESRSQVVEEHRLNCKEKNRIHGEAIIQIATEAGVIDTTLEKAKKTEEKLRTMRELYVAHQWDNATELLEWSGFFEGAAIVHWALVRGAGESLNNEQLITVANEAIGYHYELLEKSESELGTKGQDKAQA